MCLSDLQETQKHTHKHTHMRAHTHTHTHTHYTHTHTRKHLRTNSSLLSSICSLLRKISSFGQTVDFPQFLVSSTFNFLYLHICQPLHHLLPGMLIFVLVLVLKDSLRTIFKSLSLSWSLGVRSLSLSWSLWIRSLSLSWSLWSSPCPCPCF